MDIVYPLRLREVWLLKPFKTCLVPRSQSTSPGWESGRGGGGGLSQSLSWFPLASRGRIFTVWTHETRSNSATELPVVERVRSDRLTTLHGQRPSPTRPTALSRGQTQYAHSEACLFLKKIFAMHKITRYKDGFSVAGKKKKPALPRRRNCKLSETRVSRVTCISAVREG